MSSIKFQKFLVAICQILIFVDCAFGKSFRVKHEGKSDSESTLTTCMAPSLFIERYDVCHTQGENSHVYLHENIHTCTQLCETNHFISGSCGSILGQCVCKSIERNRICPPSNDWIVPSEFCGTESPVTTTIQTLTTEEPETPTFPSCSDESGCPTITLPPNPFPIPRALYQDSKEININN